MSYLLNYFFLRLCLSCLFISHLNWVWEESAWVLGLVDGRADRSTCFSCIGASSRNGAKVVCVTVDVPLTGYRLQL